MYCVNSLGREGVGSIIAASDVIDTGRREPKEQVELNVRSVCRRVDEVGFCFRRVGLFFSQVIAGRAQRHNGCLGILAILQHIEREYIPFPAVYRFLSFKEGLFGIEEIDIGRPPSPGNQVASGGDIEDTPFARIALFGVYVGGVIGNVKLNLGVQGPEFQLILVSRLVVDGVTCGYRAPTKASGTYVRNRAQHHKQVAAVDDFLLEGHSNFG